MRYNVRFSDDGTTVRYTGHNFQTFLANESCSTCSMNDSLVLVNRRAARARAGARRRGLLRCHVWRCVHAPRMHAFVRRVFDCVACQVWR